MKKEVIVTDRDLPADVRAAIEQGRKIEAIRLLREKTGLGLANAKVLVDRAASRYSGTAPTLVEEESSVPKLLRALFLATLGFVLFYLFFDA